MDFPDGTGDVAGANGSSMTIAVRDLWQNLVTSAGPPPIPQHYSCPINSLRRCCGSAVVLLNNHYVASGGKDT